MKAMCVVGARPNFMKAAPVIDALRRYEDVQVMLVHTGQHYDHQMSTLFFQELGMSSPRAVIPKFCLLPIRNGALNVYQS